MTGSPMLTERSASVLEVDPRLAAVLIDAGAGALARARLLPVLSLEIGEWEPPERGELGPQTAWLAVLGGWVRHDTYEAFGPGDALDPWSDGGAWCACTPVRLAVIGAALRATLDAAPDVDGAALSPRARPLRLCGPDGETPEERLLALLWRLAARWGRPGAAGLALPKELDPAALATLMAVPRAKADEALAALLASGALRRAADGGWQLPPPARRNDSLRGRRDELRARLAEQFVLSRAATEHAHALGDELYARRAAYGRRPNRAKPPSP